MSFIPSQRVNVNPSITLPGHILTTTQASAYFDLLADGEPETLLGSETLNVYANVLDIRTQIQGAQAAPNELPGVAITAQQIGAPAFIFYMRAEYNHHEIANASDWGFSLTEANRLGARQAFFQALRDTGLYGYNASAGQGIINAPGITETSLPADTYGNTTVATYDNGQLATFMLDIIRAILQRTYKLGDPAVIHIVGPQRILAAMEWNVVQLTQAQRPGAGTMSTKELIQMVAQGGNTTVTWGYDDTLEGQGEGGTDAVVFTMPQFTPRNASRFNTNEFSKLSPQMVNRVRQLIDMPAPLEITVPLPGGATDTTFEMRMTSGWVLQSELVTVASMAP